MINFVECGGQIRVQTPIPVSACGPLRVVKDGIDGVGATPTRAKPIGTGFEPGLPFGLQRVTDPRLMTPIHEHWNS